MVSQQHVQTLAVAFLLSLSITLTVIFNMAVLNGGSTQVIVNRYGEMIPELLLLHIIVWPVISVALSYWIFSDSTE